MKLLDFFKSHKHYWGVPIKQPDGQNVQICYGCGKQRTVLLRFETQAGAAQVEANIVNALYRPLS